MAPFTVFVPVQIKDSTFAPYRYEWDFNSDGKWDTVTSSNRLSVSKQPHWTLVAPAESAQFPVKSRLISVIKSSGYRDTSDVGTVTLTLTKPALHTVLEMVTQPNPKTSLALGSPFTITATAKGTGTLKYQWAKDALPLPTQKSAVLSIPSVTKADEGTYTCTISDSTGASVISNPAALTILSAPTRVIFGDTLTEVTDQSYWLGKTLIRYLPTVDVSWGGHHTHTNALGAYCWYWPDTTYGDTTVMIWGDTATPFGDEIFE